MEGDAGRPRGHASGSDLLAAVPPRQVKAVGAGGDRWLGWSHNRAVIREALRLLQASELGPDYAAAWDEWPDDERDAWDATVADGLSTGP